jgi:hypothetical protein
MNLALLDSILSGCVGMAEAIALFKPTNRSSHPFSKVPSNEINRYACTNLLLPKWPYEASCLSCLT